MKGADVERRHDGASDSLVNRVVFIPDNEQLTKGCLCTEIFTLVQNQLVHGIRFDGGLAYYVQLNDGDGCCCSKRRDDSSDDDGYFDEGREDILVHGDDGRHSTEVDGDAMYKWRVYEAGVANQPRNTSYNDEEMEHHHHDCHCHLQAHFFC